MVSNLSGSVTKRVYLKTTFFDVGYDLLPFRDFHDFNVIVSDNKRGQFVIDRRVLNQGAMSASAVWS